MSTETLIGVLIVAVTLAPFINKLICNGKYALSEDLRDFRDECRAGFKDIRDDVKDILSRI